MSSRMDPELLAQVKEQLRHVQLGSKLDIDYTVCYCELLRHSNATVWQSRQNRHKNAIWEYQIDRLLWSGFGDHHSAIQVEGNLWFIFASESSPIIFDWVIGLIILFEAQHFYYLMEIG